MATTFTRVRLTKNNPGIFTRACIIFLLACLSQSNQLFAHTVDYFSTCGYACSGSSVTIDVHISNVNSSSKYNWQYRDNSNVWKCFVNGANTINGVSFTVSGATGTGVKTNLPLTIQNAKMQLDDVEVRLLIADGGTPCSTNASYTIYGQDKMLRLHVLSGSDCGTIVSNCGSGGCSGNMLNDGNGYYGGFENGTVSPAASDYSLSTTTTSCGQYKIVNNVQQAQSGLPLFAPHSGNYMLYADGSSVSSGRVWYKTANVTAGNIYQFSAWVANANSTSNQRASISLKVNGTTLTGATLTVSSVAGDWLYVTGSYIANTTATVTLQIYDNNTSCIDNDFVLDDICFKTLGSAVDLGNLVWNDIDGDGRKDSNEPPVAGATVKLYTDNNSDNIADGAAIKTTTTDANGIYGFLNLAPGRYIVGVVLPAGYTYGPSISTSATPDNNIDNDNNGIVQVGANAAGSEERTKAITMSNTDNSTLDLALCGNSSIGDFVWNDKNTNGIQDAGEPGIANVTVKITYPDGVTTATTVTDANGIYHFTALAPGVHKITFTTPAGFTPSAANQGSDDTKDSDPISGTASVTVNAGTINNTIDAGFFPTGSNALSIGDLVWNDINADGNKDSEEPGIGGATIKLYTDNNSDNIADGAAIQTTTTSADGSYAFSNLTPGKYIVGIVLPAGYTYGPGVAAGISSSSTPDDNIDNDNNGIVHIGANQAGSEERTNAITLSVGDEPVNDGDGPNANSTLDLALCGAGKIGDFVWNDANKNGVQDANEMGIGKVTVVLTFPDNTTWTALTNAAGMYSFINLGPGNYKVQFQTPLGMTPSPANAGTDDTKDSDPVSGLVTLTLAAGQINTTIDAGFYRNATCSPTAIDTDGDCVADIDDIDDDNDGILDVVESGGYDPLKDCDGDGIPNYKDPTPGCPVPSGNDIYGVPYKPIVWTDCNNDGINDFFDWDKDGIINELDLDSDNDGILDVQETRDDRRVDDNNDGMVDGVDNDHDGLLSTADYNDNVPGGPGLTPEDLDRDGTPNYLDLDSDGDGLVDNREALELDASGGAYFGLVQGTNDDDHDGVRTINYTANENDADNFQGFGAKGIVLKDNDHDGIPDAYDIDSDNDGITDNVEAQPTCSEKQPSGIDADKDGLDDAYDVDISNCPPRGAGITPYDKDFDGTPDIRDLDTDNDGAPDLNEGSGIPGNFVTKTGDLDKDGLLDEFDIFNIRTATSDFTANVVHSNMGVNGSFDGPVIGGSVERLPGANCPSDRDWRNVSLLPVTLLDFKGNLNRGAVKLSWTAVNETEMSHYNVERSLDGTTFTVIGKVTATNNVSGSAYNYIDDVSDITNANVYYRLRQVDKSGNGKLSNILVFKLNSKTANALAISPNPASTYFIVKVNTVKEGLATIRITDMLGKVMTTQSSRLSAGTNAISFSDLRSYSSATYNVQVILNDETLNQKVVIIK